LNVDWAEVVSVDHVVKFLHMIKMVRSCVKIWWEEEVKKEIGK